MSQTWEGDFTLGNVTGGLRCCSAVQVGRTSMLKQTRSHRIYLAKQTIDIEMGKGVASPTPIIRLGNTGKETLLVKEYNAVQMSPVVLISSQASPPCFELGTENTSPSSSRTRTHTRTQRNKKLEGKTRSQKDFLLFCFTNNNDTKSWI